MNLDFKKELSNVDIQNICDKLGIKINRICMKDELGQSKLKNGNYIINLQNHNQSGSHWCCFVKRNRVIYYFDPFGVLPPNDEMKVFKQEHEQLHYNERDIQDINSILCGYFCIGFFIFIKHCNKRNTTYVDCCDRYSKMFNNDTKKNDAIIKTFITKYWKSS